MVYDPITYWKGEGLGATTINDPTRMKQESYILTALKRCGNFKSFLDLGCGFGRVTHLILQNFPQLEVVHGVDVSPERLSSAVVNCQSVKQPFQDVTFFNEEFLKFESDRKYDVVFSCEVIMHALSKDLKAHIEKTIELSNSHIINLDWWEPTTPTYEIAEWNFMHDYPGIYEDFVLQGKIKQMRSYNIGDKQFIFHSIK